jgi:hypothetical protein
LTKAGFNVAQVATDVFGKTGMMIIEGLLAGKKPIIILHIIEETMGYRLSAPKETLLDALEGTMSELTRDSIRSLLDIISFVSGKLAELDKKLEQSLINGGFLPEIELLETIPGISRIAAIILLVELGGDLTDFRSADAFASWAGMCPGHNESAGKRKDCRTRPGNRYLRRILCEIANAAVKTKCYFKEKFQSLKVRRGFKRAKVAIGHKILRVVYHMLIKCEPYKDRLVDYQEMVTKKNAPRWLRNLKKYNIIKQQATAGQGEGL